MRTQNRSVTREPVDIPRERHEGWGDDKATPTPEEEAHRHELVESLTPSSAPQTNRPRYAIRDAASNGPNEVVDNDEEGGNNETAEPTNRPAGDPRIDETNDE